MKQGVDKQDRGVTREAQGRNRTAIYTTEKPWKGNVPKANSGATQGDATLGSGYAPVIRDRSPPPAGIGCTHRSPRALSKAIPARPSAQR